MSACTAPRPTSCRAAASRSTTPAREAPAATSTVTAGRSASPVDRRTRRPERQMASGRMAARRHPLQVHAVDLRQRVDRIGHVLEGDGPAARAEAADASVLDVEGHPPAVGHRPGQAVHQPLRVLLTPEAPVDQHHDGQRVACAVADRVRPPYLRHLGVRRAVANGLGAHGRTRSACASLHDGGPVRQHRAHDGTPTLQDPVALGHATDPLDPLEQPHGDVAAERCGHGGGEPGPSPEGPADEHPHQNVGEREQDEATQQLHRRLDALVGGSLGDLLHDLERDEVDEDPDDGQGDREQHPERSPQDREAQAAVASPAHHELGVVHAQQDEVSLIGREVYGERLHRRWGRLPPSGQTRRHRHLIGQVDLCGTGRAGCTDNHRGETRQIFGLRPRGVRGSDPGQLCRHVIGDGAHRVPLVTAVRLGPRRDAYRLADPHEGP